MRKLNLPFLIADWARPVLLALAALTLVGGLFVFRLDTLTPAASGREAEFAAASQTVSQLLDNPLHIYQRAGNVVLFAADWHSLFAARALNALLGVLAVIAFYLVVKRWYTPRLSLLATILFASSSWLLFMARSAAPDMSFVLTLGLILGGVLLLEERRQRAALAIILASGVLLLYAPATVWFVLAAAIWQRKLIRQTFADLSALWQAVIVAGLALSVLPLMWRFINQPDLIRTWLGLPAQLPHIGEYFKNLVNVPVHLFISGPGDPTIGIGHLPILDALTTAMVAIGVYAHARRWQLDRSKLVIGAMAAGWLIIALGGPLGVSFLLPFVYLAAAGGVALLLRQWFTVFPRNPLARVIGVAAVTVAVSMACFYHVNKYFIAWPAVPATKSSFQQEI
jgi:4-amino-4-deoxy-L-arabinose transferase-like glycosyltransferase